MNKDKIQGIIYIVLAAVFFSLMSVFVRLAGDLPTLQKVFFRNFIAMLIAAVTLVKNRQLPTVKAGCRLSMVARCAFGFGGMIANFYAVDHMNLADANMLNKLSPFFAIIASVIILKEKVSKLEWAAVFIAFGGALFIIKPSFQSTFICGLIAALGGCCAGFAYSFVRKLTTSGVPGNNVVFCFSMSTCVVSLLLNIGNFTPMTMSQTACLLMAGVTGAGGQFTITKAYTKAPAREISVYDYSQILFAALWGMLFFGQLPDVLSVIGYVIIIGVAVWKWQYNLKQYRETEQA